MSKTILIIDDEEAIRKLLSRILVKEGYSVLLAENGRDGLNVLEKEKVDLIVLDMNMPLMNGLEFLKKNREEEISSVPVLMMSGSQDTDHRLESYRLGVYDFITKPEETEVLLRRIENGLRMGEMKHFNDFIKIELLMARKLQKYLFPDPVFDDGPFRIFNWSRPLSDIGGDLYDYILLRNGKILFFIADVSGHSISGAIFTAIVKMIFRNALKETLAPGKILTYMNRELADNLPAESFVTAFCGLMDPATGKLIYANAGHPSPFLIRSGELSPMLHNDPFLGPIKNSRFEDIECTLQPKDQVFMFTDGVMDILDYPANKVNREDLTSMLEDSAETAESKFEKVIKIFTTEGMVCVDDCTFTLMEYIEN